MSSQIVNGLVGWSLDSLDCLVKFVKGLVAWSIDCLVKVVKALVAWSLDCLFEVVNGLVAWSYDCRVKVDSIISRSEQLLVLLKRRHTSKKITQSRGTEHLPTGTKHLPQGTEHQREALETS